MPLESLETKYAKMPLESLETECASLVTEWASLQTECEKKSFTNGFELRLLVRDISRFEKKAEALLTQMKKVKEGNLASDREKEGPLASEKEKGSVKALQVEEENTYQLSEVERQLYLITEIRYGVLFAQMLTPPNS